MSSNTIIHETGIDLNPRIIYESLGSKIIEANSIAIAEQIKNATDAGASKICVDFSQINEDLIEIRDNGSGMSIEEVKENWFFVATNNKKNSHSQLGGKGIGRFSLFRLANSIEIETISNGVKCEFKLLKEDLEYNENLSDFTLKITESSTTMKNGTTIRLTNTNRLNLLEIQQELENLNQPGNPKTFEVIYPKNSQVINYYSPSDCVSDAPFNAKIEFSSNKILSYKFSCNYKGQNIYNNSLISNLQTKISKQVPDFDIGKTTVIIYNYYFDNSSGNVTKQREDSLKERFLNAYQGISVYRNNYKIYGHGENDWLKLAEKRLMRAADNIDNKLTFGYIILDSDKSTSLEEKTNREGFIRNEASTYFHDLIELIVSQFGKDRKESIALIKKNIKLGNNTPSSGAKSTGSETTGPESTSSGTTGPESTSSGTTGPEPTSSGTTGPEPTSSGTTGLEPTSSGTSDFGASDPSSGTTGSDNESDKDGSKTNKYNKNTTIGYIDPQIKTKIKSTKVSSLINEITTINVERYPLATAFLLRSLTEVMMDEYLRINLSKIRVDFKDYKVDSNKNIKKEFINKKTNILIEKDIPIKSKLMDFKKHLSHTNKFDSRSLKHLDDLVDCIDDINLAMHWTDKSVSTNQLQTNWQNSIFFIEFICTTI